MWCIWLVVARKQSYAWNIFCVKKDKMTIYSSFWSGSMEEMDIHSLSKQLYVLWPTSISGSNARPLPRQPVGCIIRDTINRDGSLSSKMLSASLWTNVDSKYWQCPCARRFTYGMKYCMDSDWLILMMSKDHYIRSVREYSLVS